MRLHRLGAIKYVEYDISQATRFGFSESVACHQHRHTSAILVEKAEHRVRCLVDSEDSFFWISPLISEADRYFCAGYNSEFFEHKRFLSPYHWQTEEEVQFYRKRTAELVGHFGIHFCNVRKFVPIGPTMRTNDPVSGVFQRWHNLKHKINSARSDKLLWHHRYLDYEVRYARLLALRKCTINYDIVLLDTLWGWPRHRANLHQQLSRLSHHYHIHSQLNWNEPVPFDGSIYKPLDPVNFPMETSPITNYERMLASSRLAVFATGFHWGWRAIMCFALLLGLPIFMDKLMMEAWFGFNDFVIFYNNNGDWREIEKHLQSIDETEWLRIKAVNQRVYDGVMAPDRVAEYFIRTALQ
jgi:hypothetical protein